MRAADEGRKRRSYVKVIKASLTGGAECLRVVHTPIKKKSVHRFDA